MTRLLLLLAALAAGVGCGSSRVPLAPLPLPENALVLSESREGRSQLRYRGQSQTDGAIWLWSTGRESHVADVPLSALQFPATYVYRDTTYYLLKVEGEDSDCLHYGFLSPDGMLRKVGTCDARFDLVTFARNTTSFDGATLLSRLPAPDDSTLEQYRVRTLDLRTGAVADTPARGDYAVPHRGGIATRGAPLSPHFNQFVWNGGSDRLIFALPGDAQPFGLAVTGAEGREYVVAQTHLRGRVTLHVLDPTADYAELATVGLDGYFVNQVVLSCGGSILVAGVEAGPGFRPAYVVYPHQTKPVTFEGKSSIVAHVADGAYVVTATATDDFVTFERERVRVPCEPPGGP